MSKYLSYLKYWTKVCLLLPSTLLSGAGQIEIKDLKTHVITESCVLQDYHEEQIDLNSVVFSDLKELPFLDEYISYEDQEIYWISCAIVNKTDKQDWIVKLPFLTITSGELYLVSDGRIDSGPIKVGVFDKRGKEDALLSIGTKFIYTHINLNKGKPYHLLLRLQNEKKNLSINPYIHIIPEDGIFQKSQTRLNIWVSIFTGWIMIICFLSLIIYAKTKDLSYLYYGMYILTLMIWACYSAGILREWCFNYLTFIEPKYFFILRSFGILGTLYYILFIVEFANLGNYFSFINKYSRYIIPFAWFLLSCDWAILLWSNFNLVYSNFVEFISTFIWMIFNLVMIPLLWKIKDRPYIKITIAGLLIVSLGIVALFIRMILSNFITVDAVEIFYTTIFEIALFSYGLSVKLADSLKVQLENETIRGLLSEKETLLREIHHRVKNNLQVVSSLLRIQSNETSDPIAIEVLKQGQSRVQSMSLIHQDLYQHDNLSGINMQDYLGKLVNNLFDTYNISSDQISCNTDIDPILLDIDRVVPLGLIINELISNALKHAFPHDSQGTIHVSFKRKQDHLLLIVADNGSGIHNETNNAESTGYRLINAFLQNLDGEMSIKSNNGFRVAIKINDY